MSGYGKIIQRFDGSYVINGGLYHVPTEWELWLDVDNYAKANPLNVTQEPKTELTVSQKIERVIVKYARDLSRLVEACTTAQMLDNVEDAEAAKIEYADLLRQQGEEIAAIQNGGV